jgi:hypothetical protein
MALRVAVGTIFALTLFTVPGTVSPEPAAAGSSCTGWTSKVRPPKSIKVLRTRTGEVETVNFRVYVAEVMASGEWPSRLKMATLEAGALATKQYAWYYALRGHHRSSYVSRGRCYDVRDDTRDQLYRPERATPTARQYRAIDSTWALTLRKNGRFFLTGYRAGSVSSCAADANGWKLYAKSVNACAKKGWSSKRILNRYLSPNLTFVWSTATGPVVRPARIALKVGHTLSGGAAKVRWNPVDPDADVVKYQLQRKVGLGRWQNVELADVTARSTQAWLKVGRTNYFRVRAKDSKGRFGPWSYLSRRRVSIQGPVGLELGSDAFETADTTPPKVVVDLTGRAMALVARTGPGMGQAKVFVDGQRVATIDLERAVPNESELVWTRHWSRTRTRTLKVKAVLDGDPVEFNGFLTLR